MKPLPPALRDRLSKLLPRLASPFEGERTATLAAIERVMRAEGFDFNDFEHVIANPAAITNGGAKYEPRPHCVEVERGKRCDNYDTVFLSERQAAWLVDLAARAGLPGDASER